MIPKWKEKGPKTTIDGATWVVADLMTPARPRRVREA